MVLKLAEFLKPSRESLFVVTLTSEEEGDSHEVSSKSARQHRRLFILPRDTEVTGGRQGIHLRAPGHNTWFPLSQFSGRKNIED